MFRKLVLFLAILAFGFAARSQFYFYYGYGTSFPKLDSLNYIVERYNETRNYLTDEMKPFRSLDGFSMTMGVGMVGFDFGVSYLNRSEKRYAEGPSQGVDFRREVKASINAFDIHTGATLIAGDNTAIAIGVKVEIGKIAVKTKVAELSEIKDTDWNKTVDELHGGAGAYFRIYLGNPGLAIEPYVTWPLFSTDIAGVNEALNPLTYHADPWEIRLKPTTFGISFMFGGFSFAN